MELNQLRKYTSSRISIVVPCFNEEETISIFYTETLKVLKEMNIESYEFVFVDDGSSDNTLLKFRELSEKDTKTPPSEIEKAIKLKNEYYAEK